MSCQLSVSKWVLNFFFVVVVACLACVWLNFILFRTKETDTWQVGSSVFVLPHLTSHVPFMDFILQAQLNMMCISDVMLILKCNLKTRRFDEFRFSFVSFRIHISRYFSHSDLYSTSFIHFVCTSFDMMIKNAAGQNYIKTKTFFFFCHTILKCDKSKRKT